MDDSMKILPTSMRAPARWLAAVVSACTLVATVHATGIRTVSVDEMLRGSQLVFEGRVVASEARKSANSRMIHTYVTFEVLDVIRGSYPRQSVELSFLGGSAGGRRLSVDGMQPPRVGEHGIYFVESLSGDLVHPFYGWSQGHFVVVDDAGGIERVVTQAGLPVIDIQSTAGSRSDELSDGTALGVTVGGAGEVERAMTVNEFEERLAAM